MGVLTLALLAACGPSNDVVGDFEVTVDAYEGLSITHLDHGPVIEGLRPIVGTGDATVSMRFGAFRFEDVTAVVERPSLRRPDGRLGVLVIDLRAAADGSLGTLVVSAGGPDALLLEVSTPGYDRFGFSAPCDADDHFLGLGGHAQDVDHVGEAFAVWVQEPGVGKTTDDEEPADWPVAGPKHATSFPVPFLLRPHRSHALLLDTTARVDVDLCATDPDAFSAVAWADGSLRTVLFAGAEPLDPVRALAASSGGYTLPPPWAFAPWNDAIRGSAEVRQIASTLREAGAPSSVIWTEDWKGASQTAFGYHLSGEWSLDETLYPDAATLADELEADGFKWLAYFAPFVRSGTTAWEDAVAAGVLIEDETGAPYVFTGFTFEDESMLDLTAPAARSWAQERMQAALDLGFDGWMADFAEYRPFRPGPSIS